MHLDVLDLRAFYYRSPLGRAAQKVIRQELLRMWPDVKGMTVAGYGFAVPLLRPFLTDARRVVGLMPGPQGVMPWPAAMPNVSVLVEDRLWPMQTGSVDRLVLLHGLETSDDPGAVMDEAWRVLGPGGRAVFIVPNRTGLWSRSDATPFGYGRPYTLGQLELQLRLHRFVPEHAMSTLYQPPSSRRMWRRVAPLMERFGRHIPAFAAGGVVMIEAVKHVAAPTRPGMAARVRLPLGQVLGGAEPARSGVPGAVPRANRPAPQIGFDRRPDPQK